MQYGDLAATYPDLFDAAMGAEAVLDLLRQVDLDELARELRHEIRTADASSPQRTKAIRRLRVVEAFRTSGQRPQHSILTILPVMPPGLRPIIPLDGGRFAASDLNELYRRVIMRNNRLKRMMELEAPEVILRNEKRLLQEAVDCLIDNGRHGRTVRGPHNRTLKSLSDLFRGKQGRFRQNLLGKRVDYSGRSVIVVGPDLELHQCGLPKTMAMELFKPFVLRKLIELEYAPNAAVARRQYERGGPEVWDALEAAIKDRPVLLNRAPTLHRLGIQAFDVVLVEGNAIQLHPLACAAFNADFDGDHMAVHVPLSPSARDEARTRLMSTRNILSPANGEPVVNPTKDIVLGCHYLTAEKEGERGEGMVFAGFEEARLALEMGRLSLHARIYVLIPQRLLEGERILTGAGIIDRADLVSLPNSSKARGLQTTAGRIIFNQALPTGLVYRNQLQDKNSLRDMVAEIHASYGPKAAAEAADTIKHLGFQYATRSGLSLSVADLTIPDEKQAIVARAVEAVDEAHERFEDGELTMEDLYRERVAIWDRATDDIAQAVTRALDPLGTVGMMSLSGAARGGFTQVRQITGMRGLMADPSGKIIEVPITSNFREGLSVHEYFISTHGARKTLIDGALRTPEAGYLTRRLVDVAQNVVVREHDCGTKRGLELRFPHHEFGASLAERLAGRVLAQPFFSPSTGLAIAAAGAQINPAQAETIAAELAAAPNSTVEVRSPVICTARHGVCQLCYGWDLSTRRLVELAAPVGVIAAQSIGEPGTQLTMRTRHSGGVKGEDIVQGLPRVDALFEARAGMTAGATEQGGGAIPASGGDIADLRALLRLGGPSAVAAFLLMEVQAVYRTHGVTIADKHIEVIIRQMLCRVQVEESGDTDLLPGDIVDRGRFAEINAAVLAQGGEPAMAALVLLGISRASLATEGFLTAAAFEQTIRVLTDAAMARTVDRLEGLKANIILGRRIPAGTGFPLPGSERGTLPAPCLRAKPPPWPDSLR